jgi:DNA-binding NtrC family response regulator
MFDLGILDINLKGRTSASVAEILKARNIPVIVASGYSHDVVSAACPGAVFLQKPYSVGQLEHAIAVAIPALQRKTA